MNFYSSFYCPQPLTNILKNVLTFVVKYAKISLEYIGIAVYFDQLKTSQKRAFKKFEAADQNKKQKQLLGQNSPTITQFNIYLAKAIWREIVMTFCFLIKRLFNLLLRRPLTINSQRSKISFILNLIQEKNKNYVSWLLPLARHLARNRSQQNHGYSLGRRGVDPQGPSRQPRLALLYQRPGRGNPTPGKDHRLFPRGPQYFQTLQESSVFGQCCPRLDFVSVFNFEKISLANQLKYS